MKSYLHKLNDIHEEREILLKEISIAQARVAELNIQKQNIIME